MTTTPSTVNELLELNQQDDGDQLLELLEDLNPVETAKVVLLLTTRLSGFHWSTVDRLRENGDPNDQLTAWIHDGTLWSNIQMMLNNISDLCDS